MTPVPQSRASERIVLEPCNGGYRIKRLLPDHDFEPPLWVDFGYLNEGRKFPSREAARQFMLAASSSSEGRPDGD